MLSYADPGVRPAPAMVAGGRRRLYVFSPLPPQRNGLADYIVEYLPMLAEDFDLFLPPDPDNLLQTWGACHESSLELWLGNEPLERPRDRWLAERVVAQRALIRVSGSELVADLTFVMAGFEFAAVWAERREFLIEGVSVPVARLLHIISSKHAAGRNKDRLFLATHRDALEQLLTTHESE